MNTARSACEAMDIGELATRVAAALDGRSVATVESCTGGRLAQAFSVVAGAEAWFRGGLVAYQVPVKRALLAVTSPSVYTEDAAAEMANAGAVMFDADVVVASTGVAGAEPVDGKAPGTVMVATRVDGRTRTYELHFEGSAESVCDQATCAALERVAEALMVRARPAE